MRLSESAKGGVAGDNSCQKGEQVPNVRDEGSMLLVLLALEMP